MARASTSNLHRFNLVVLSLVLVGLYFTTWVNYLLFHSLAELFSIVVAFSLFVIAWHSWQYLKNPYLSFVGVAYLFIGLLDLVHTLAYPGMPIFPDFPYAANQLWIGARYLEAMSLLMAFIFLYRQKRAAYFPTFFIFSGITIVIVASIFYWRIFPECFVAGVGLTPFKKISEYIICVFLAMALFLLYWSRQQFDERTYLLLFWSIVCTIISELAFTFYVSHSGLSNLVGHYFKIFSFFLVYQAIIRGALEKPHETIFRDLDQANQKLRGEVENRKKAEAEKETLIDELKSALDEIKTLKGIIPICSHCKKIRDDKGYWNQLEKFIHDHSDAQFSHGICPECLDKHYPAVLKKKLQEKQSG